MCNSSGRSCYVVILRATSVHNLVYKIGVVYTDAFFYLQWCWFWMFCLICRGFLHGIWNGQKINLYFLFSAITSKMISVNGAEADVQCVPEKRNGFLFEIQILPAKWLFGTLSSNYFNHSCVKYASYELHQMKEKDLSFTNMCHLLIIILIKLW